VKVASARVRAEAAKRVAVNRTLFVDFAEAIGSGREPEVRRQWGGPDPWPRPEFAGSLRKSFGEAGEGDGDLRAWVDRLHGDIRKMHVAHVDDPGPRVVEQRVGRSWR
jgi:hypothetical protein